MSDVIVIGVAGGTGSGKTTLVKALVNRFGDNISVLSHDNYYKRHDEMSYEERTHLNYERYVEPCNPIVFLPWDASKFVMQSRKDGYNHLYATA